MYIFELVIGRELRYYYDLGNLIWEQVSGNVAVVNDIDIFIFDKLIKEEEILGLPKVRSIQCISLDNKSVVRTDISDQDSLKYYKEIS